MEFPGGEVGLGSSIVTAAAWVTAVAWVRPLVFYGLREQPEEMKNRDNYHFAVYLKLIRHCKLTILQFLKVVLKNEGKPCNINRHIL